MFFFFVPLYHPRNVNSLINNEHMMILVSTVNLFSY